MGILAPLALAALPLLALILALYLLKLRRPMAPVASLHLWSSLTHDGTTTLITSDAHASVVVPSTGDRSRLREAIGRLRPQVADTDMSEAIKLASVMVARQSNSSIWVLSDGAFPSVKDSVETLPA